MKNKIYNLLASALLCGAGLLLLTHATGCGSTNSEKYSEYSENISDRPWSEPRGFQYQNSSADR